jgi:hypothetical protein
MSRNYLLIGVIAVAFGFLALCGIREIHAIRRDQARDARTQEFNQNAARVIDLIQDFRSRP